MVPGYDSRDLPYFEPIILYDLFPNGWTMAGWLTDGRSQNSVAFSESKQDNYIIKIISYASAYGEGRKETERLLAWKIVSTEGNRCKLGMENGNWDSAGCDAGALWSQALRLWSTLKYQNQN